MARSRNFCFTLNNYSEDVYQHLLSVDVKYVVIGKEVGESGTPHLQGYMSFKDPRTLSTLKKINGQAHWEICKGSPSQNRAYCIKDGKFEEVGVLPKDPVDKGKMEQDAWSEAFKAVQEGRLEDVRPDILCRSLKQVEYAVERVKASKRKLCDLEVLDNEWRWGEPLSGKSEGARKENPGLYVKMASAKWFDNYDYEEVVLLDDVAEDAGKHTQSIKNLADVYPVRVEVKGGSMLIRPRRVIVTSNLHPREIYSGVHLDAIVRRFKIIEFKHDPLFVPPIPANTPREEPVGDGPENVVA